MAKTFRQTPLRRIGNRLLTPLIKLGLAPKGLHLLSVPGRKTGRVYTTPVNLVLQDDGARYLVAPYGPEGWVRNARAAAEVTLRRGRREERLRLKELSPASAAPVLKMYLRLNSITRPYFDAAPDDPDAAFAAEASRHPVFRLV